MKLSLQIEPDDIERVRTFLAARQDDPFVKHRVAKNLGPAIFSSFDDGERSEKEMVW